MRLKISQVRGDLGVAHSTFHVITLRDTAWRFLAYALERGVNSLALIRTTTGYRLADLPLRRCYSSRVSLKVKVLDFVKSGGSRLTKRYYRAYSQGLCLAGQNQGLTRQAV